MDREATRHRLRFPMLTGLLVAALGCGFGYIGFWPHACVLFWTCGIIWGASHHG